MTNTAVVTGASTGIGAAFARALAGRAKRIVLVARDRSRLEGIADELRTRHSVDATVLAADLTVPGDLERVAQAVRDEASLDLLVNNAGCGTVTAFAKSELAREDQQVRLNVLALVHLTHAALAGMVARGRGAIVNVSSVQGFVPSPFLATYGATKAFVNSFTESIATEVGPKGVVVQALCPGFTRTEFQKRAGIRTDGVPTSAWMTPEAVVEASLTALARGDLYCIPGAQNRTLVGLSKLVPGPIARRLSATLIRRAVG
jgi:short-subunit dehydrogenase